jgi:hypothetical protein
MLRTKSVHAIASSALWPASAETKLWNKLWSHLAKFYLKTLLNTIEILLQAECCLIEFVYLKMKLLLADKLPLDKKIVYP